MMRAAASSIPPQDDGHIGREAAFQRRLLELSADCERRWWSTGEEPPLLGDRVGQLQQYRNGRRALRLLDHLAQQIEAYPTAESERRSWRENLTEEVREFGRRCLGWPAGYRNLLFADAFFASTMAFSRRARAFDPWLSLSDLGQALRNVWIANSLQMLLGRPVCSSAAIFGYSMLYPVTDNYLDDSDVPAAAKRRFNHLLGYRLAGDAVTPADSRQRAAFRLVETIEAQYPRRAHPEVYWSLLAIHHAQIESLRQQAGEQLLDEGELLRLSVNKGGTSVLADGYLAAGTLSADEAAFCFAYGVFLQLLDDLQDAGVDRRAGHRTLFSTRAGRTPLDSVTSRLYHYMHRLVDASACLAAPRHADLRDLILRNCTFLLVTAVAAQRDFFSARFLRRLERRWHFRFSTLEKLRRRAARLGRRHALSAAVLDRAAPAEQLGPRTRAWVRDQLRESLGPVLSTPWEARRSESENSGGR